MAEYLFGTKLWAHFRTVVWEPDPDGILPNSVKLQNSWHEHCRIIGFRDDVALICDETGHVKKVTDYAAELAEGGDVPDEEGCTWAVSVEVDAWEPGDSE